MRHSVYLFYIDDSGDTGLKSAGSPTDAFVLCALIVQDHAWLSTLDEIVTFRRFLRKAFGIGPRAELKAGYLIHGTGPFSGSNIGDAARLRIFRLALRFQRKVGTIQTWAVVIGKTAWEKQNKGEDIRQAAWRTMIERIERFTFNGKDTCVVFPDEGYPDFVQMMFRRMRRFSQVPSAFQSGVSLSRPAQFLVEDPNFRRSQNSYFVQLADLNAYAAHRHVFPQPYFGSDYWEELGDARVKVVNRLAGGPVGIVVRPGK